MILNQIKCEVISVNTDTGICNGMAKTEKGEVYIIGARTPGGKGICCQAFSALASMKLVYMYTDKMDWEKNEYFDITCPHGVVTFRLSRMKEQIPLQGSR
jgi:uncharacterized repeat protein (TIGR04076 family)